MTFPVQLDPATSGAARPGTAAELAQVRAYATELLAVVAHAAARERIQIELLGPEHEMVLVFAGQEEAPSTLMLHHFLVELAAAGVITKGIVRLDPTMPRTMFDRVCRAFDQAIARMRVLLIEYHSFTSGGVPYVFETTDPVLRARGLALYRYPARAAVALEARGRSMHIQFAEGPVGEVTSSGFYVPTRIRGDFEVSASYRLGRFEPGPDSACLALFTQNEASSFRAYAQLSATGSPPVFQAVAGLRGDVLAPLPADQEPGAFKIARRGATLWTFHQRGDGPWRELGRLQDAPADDLIIGSKIWTKVCCGGLEAEIFDLVLDGQVAPDQGDLPAVRPDPRDRA